MRVHDRTSTSAITLAPGREISLSFPEAAIRFDAGSSNYEILLDLVGLPEPGVEDLLDSGEMTDPAIDQSKIPLVGDQRLLLIGLCENKLLHPHQPIDLPTNRALALRLGWPTTAFNRKLDRPGQKFARSGVSGLVGDCAGVASDRRPRLVEHAVTSGIITVQDLATPEDV